MLLRALVAFLLLPGIVAFAAPLLLALGLGQVASLSVTALIFIALGLTSLIWCVCSFYFSGKGTLAPWSPPRNLVVVGLYRFSRNPMYVAVVLLLMGWSLLFESVALATYGVIVAMGFHLRVIFGEEPWLARTYGPQWTEYVSQVNRWVGRHGTLTQRDANG